MIKIDLKIYLNYLKNIQHLLKARVTVMILMRVLQKVAMRALQKVAIMNFNYFKINRKKVINYYLFFT